MGGGEEGGGGEGRWMTNRCSKLGTEGDHKTIKISVWGNHSAIQLVSVKAPAIETAASVQSPAMISSGCVHSGRFPRRANVLSLRPGCSARLPQSADEIDITVAIKARSYLAASFAVISVISWRFFACPSCSRLCRLARIVVSHSSPLSLHTVLSVCIMLREHSFRSNLQLYSSFRQVHTRAWVSVSVCMNQHSVEPIKLVHFHFTVIK